MERALTNKDAIKKDSFMFVLIFAIWLLLILYFDPKIIANMKSGESIWAKISVGAFILAVNSFWLMGIYQTILSIFSRFVSKPLVPCEQSMQNSPSVAILYPTKDDFQSQAALSCLHQDYSNFTLYILDDSITKQKKEAIDKFIVDNPKVELIRREEKKGFKAGNLNNALQKISSKYEYFVVSDADGILPEDFIVKLLPYFSIDPSIGFVQAHQKVNPDQEFIFSNYLHYQSDLHFKYFLPAKNKYGYVMFYGHGGIIKTEVWQKVGGFPDSITEDFVFSSEARRLGYKGIFVKDVVCYEDFPEDYQKYRKRGERWTKGTTDYFFKWYPKLFFSKNATWFEKIDIILSSGRLLFGLPFLVFLFIVSLVLPLSTKYFHLPLPFYLMSTNAMPLYESIPRYFSGDYLLGGQVYAPWALEFFIVMMLYAFSDLILAVIEWYKKPIMMLGYMSQYTLICFSTILFISFTIISVIFPLKRSFFVSGVNRYTAQKDTYLIPVKPGVFTFLEVLVGILMLISILTTSNLWLAPMAFALMANPFLYTFKWETPGIHLIVIFPFILFLVISILMGFTLL